MDFSKIAPSGPQNSQKTQNWNVCVQYDFFKMNDKVQKKVKKWDFCDFHAFSRSLLGVFSVKSKKWKTLITGNRERQILENPWFFMPERVIGTRKHSFVKKVKNNFVKQYCFDSIYEKQQFLLNRSETKAKWAGSNPSKNLHSHHYNQFCAGYGPAPD